MLHSLFYQANDKHIDQIWLTVLASNTVKHDITLVQEIIIMMSNQAI